MTYLRALTFFGLALPALASSSLDELVKAAASYSAAIQQQLEVVQSGPTRARFAKSTITYAKAKTAYIHALRAAAPELISIGTGEKARSSAVDKFAESFSVAGEKQTLRSEYETGVLLEKFSGDRAIEKARKEFQAAQKLEEEFHKDFDGIDFTLAASSLLIRGPRP